MKIQKRGKTVKFKCTFNLVPKHVAVGVVSRDESDGVTNRIRFHDF